MANVKRSEPQQRYKIKYAHTSNYNCNRKEVKHIHSDLLHSFHFITKNETTTKTSHIHRHNNQREINLSYNRV